VVIIPSRQILQDYDLLIGNILVLPNVRMFLGGVPKSGHHVGI